MILEPGKTYRTRRGGIVKIVAVNMEAKTFNHAAGWLEGEITGWSIDGSYWRDRTVTESYLDIVAEVTVKETA